MQQLPAKSLVEQSDKRDKKRMRVLQKTKTWGIFRPT